VREMMLTLLLLDDKNRLWIIEMLMCFLEKTGQLGVVYQDAEVYDGRET
jgi:hypothetical protein